MSNGISVAMKIGVWQRISALKPEEAAYP